MSSTKGSIIALHLLGLVESGKLQENFWDKGKVDLRKNLGTDIASTSISLTTPAILYKNIIILGSATGEGYNASPGHISAYYANTRAFIWIFHTITIPLKGNTVMINGNGWKVKINMFF